MNVHLKNLEFGASNFTNETGHNFEEIWVLLSGHHHLSKIFRCNICGKILYSKTGAKSHNCHQFDRIMANETFRSEFRHKFAMELLLRFIASSNIPFHAIDNSFFRSLLQIFDDTFVLPGKDKIRSEMITFSDQIHDRILIDLRGQAVSLMADSCKRWGKNYEGIVVYTNERLYLYSILSAQDLKASTLSTLISDVVKECKDNNINVISVNTDNAANNKKALNGKSGSAQVKSNSHFIREPCSAHTCDLAIKDMFSKDDEFGFVNKCIETLIDHLPQGTYTPGYGPSYKTIRWRSLLNCAKFINQNLNEYKKSNIKEVVKSLKKVEKKIGWKCLVQMLEIVCNFLDQIERDLASIADILPPFLDACQKLREMKVEPADKLRKHLQYRFRDTCSLKLPIVAFLLTDKGLQYYRSMIYDRVPLLFVCLKTIEEYLKERDFAQKIIWNIKICFQYYLQYFDIQEFSKFDKPIHMWKYLITNNKIENMEPLIFFAIEILLIPSSEAAVERVFRALSELTESNMSKISRETINARLVVKFDSIFGRAGPISWEDFGNETKDIFKLKKYPIFNLNK